MSSDVIGFMVSFQSRRTNPIGLDNSISQIHILALGLYQNYIYICLAEKQYPSALVDVFCTHIRNYLYPAYKTGRLRILPSAFS